MKGVKNVVPFGTDETISRVVEQYSSMLLRLACTRLDSTADAEDAVQETFLRLLTARPVFRDAEHEKACLIRTTIHRASDIRRAAEKRNFPLEAAEAAAPESGEGALLTAVRALPKKYSAVIHLYYYEGYSIKEIGAMLGLPAATVGSRLARGRERLREAYQGADVFAFLSHEETEGIVVLEALACGIPTVLRDIPVYDGWLEDGKNIYKASNTDEFQRIVMGLLAGDLPDLTTAGRRTAEERSLEAVGERLKDIYRREHILPPLPASLPRRHAKA